MTRLPANTRPGVETQRKNIGQAAVALFAEGGTPAASVSLICRQAGVSRDTFYRCFRDKDSLIDYLYQTAVNEHIQAVLEAAELRFSDHEWLHQAVSVTVDSIVEQREVATFLFTESLDPGARAHQSIISAYENAARRMQQWCEAQYGNKPNRDIFLGLLAAAQWLVHQAIIRGGGETELATCKMAIEDLFFTVFAGLGSSRSD